MRQKLKRYLFEGEVLRLMSITMLVKPLGMITQMLVAKYYGAGVHYDAYVLTLFLVTFIDLTLGRVFTAVAVPFIIRLRAELSPRRLLGFQNATYLLFLVPGLLYLALLLVRGDLPLGLAGPGAPEETRSLSLRMLKWMAVPGLLTLVTVMFKSTLNLNKRFRVPASLPVVNSVAVITVLVALHDRLGVWTLPVAFSVSNVLQVLVAAAYAVGRRHVAPVRPHLPAGSVSKLWALSWMIMVSTTFQTVNAFLDKMFASGLVPGSISSIAYSTTIMNFGTQIFSLSLVTVMFTRMSEMLGDGDMSGCSRYLTDNLNRVARVVVPGALALTVASGEIVSVLFQRGAFTADDAERTAATLAMYMLGLPALIFNAVITKVFHALQRMKEKMWLALQFLLTNTAGNLLLIGSLKVVGLAVSSTVAINVHIALSMYVLHRYRTGLDIERYVRIMSTSYVLGLITWLVYRFSGFEGAMNGLVDGATKLEAMGVGAARAAFVFAVYLGVHQLRRLVRRRAR